PEPQPNPIRRKPVLHGLCSGSVATPVKCPDQLPECSWQLLSHVAAISGRPEPIPVATGSSKRLLPVGSRQRSICRRSGQKCLFSSSLGSDLCCPDSRIEYKQLCQLGPQLYARSDAAIPADPCRRSCNHKLCLLHSKLQRDQHL